MVEIIDILWGGVLCCLVEIIDILEEYAPIFKPEEGGLLWQGILMVFVIFILIPKLHILKA